MLDVSIYSENRVGAVPFTVRFEAVVNSGDPINFEWNFGDGQQEVSTNPIITHVYETYGLHSVALKANDSSGSVVVRENDYIKIAKLDFIATPSGGMKPLRVHFRNMSIAPAGLSFLSWNWDFGDETAGSNEESPMHVYEEEGDYNVTLDAEMA